MSEISRHPVVAATRALRFADHVTKRNEGSGNENARHPVVAATRALRFADHVTKRNEGSGNENGINCFRSTFHWLKKEHAQLNRKLKENYFPKSNNRIPVEYWRSKHL